MRSVLLLALLAPLALGGAAPDQVLVLYNADWTEDLAGTEPGPDSLEVARYYVAQHTDPQTGKKPYLLGLSCKDPKARRLDQMRLPEGSRDNTYGVRAKGSGPQPKPPFWSASHVLALTASEHGRLDPKSLFIRCGATDKEEDAQVVWADGEAKPGFDFVEAKHGKRYVRYGFASRKAFPDGFTAWVAAKAKDGKPLADFHARYVHPDGFEPDPTGPDGIRDDANYLADIEAPVKAFLEDPANKLPDGTLLRDHIVYLLVCYGLPKQVEASFGVARGARGNASDHDDGSALEARLALLYYPIAAVHQPVVFPATRGKVHGALIASRLRGTLGGANHYRHPMTHSPRKGKGLASSRLYTSYEWSAPRLPHFTPETRKAFGERFLYAATRIDGRHPEVAKHQVDGALYGNRYLTPELGWCWSGTYSSARQGAQELKYFEFRDQPPAQPKPHEAGRVLFYFGDFGYSTDYADEPAKPPVPYWRGFYPGSVAYAVRSYLGWQLTRRVSQLYHNNSRYPERMIDAGATVCATSAHGAHDTSATWPDDQVFFHHLLRGYDLAETFLMSSIYLDWLQSYIGDPLYCPELRRTELDTAPPQVAAAADIRVDLQPADGRYFARVRPRLVLAPENPEMAVASVAFWRKPEEKRTAASWRFSRRPEVLLLDLEPQATYHYELVLTDPYGNEFASAKAFGDLTFQTGPPPPARRVLAEFRYGPEDTKPQALAPKAGEQLFLPERGEVHIEFTAREPRFELLSGDRREFLLTYREFAAGGRLAAFCEPPGKNVPIFAAGQRYRLVARWRRDPAVRQASLVARDGREFLLGSSNRLCWLPVDMGSRLQVRNLGCTVHALTIYDDTHPRPLDPLYPSRFDLEGFRAADAPKPTEEPQ